MTISLTVTYHVRGEVVLDTVRQDLVFSVPAATQDDTGDLMVGGDPASSRHLNIVLLHCDRANLPTQTLVNTNINSGELLNLVPADNIIEVVAVQFCYNVAPTTRLIGLLF